MKIDLHIEQLILHHCAPGDRERVGAAVRRELERLIAERGLSQPLLKGADIARIDGGSIDVGQAATLESIGGQIAGAVLGGIANE